MYSNLLAILVLCWILAAGAQIEDNSINSMKFFQITGSRKLFRYKDQNLDNDEEIFDHKEDVQLRNYLALTSRNMLEKLQTDRQKREKAAVYLPDTLVHLEGKDFWLTNLTWGIQGYNTSTDELISFQSASVDSHKNASPMQNRQLIVFNVTFTRTLCIHGFATKIKSENRPKIYISRWGTKYSYISGITDKPELGQDAAPKNFTLFVQDARVEVLFDRLATNTRGIISKVEKELLNFAHLLVSTDILKKEGTLVEESLKNSEDEMSLMQKLASSWMVLLMDTIDDRYLRPKMLEMNQLQFKERQKNQLKNIGTIILNFLTTNPDFFPGDRLEVADEFLTRHPVNRIQLKNFHLFYVFPFSSTDLSQEYDNCPFNGIYSHTLDFNFYAKAGDQSQPNLPSVNWFHEEQAFFGDSNFTVTDFSVQLTINTDRLGEAISFAVETHLLIDEEMELDCKTCFHHFAAIHQETEMLISEIIKEKVEKLL